MRTMRLLMAVGMMVIGVAEVRGEVYSSVSDMIQVFQLERDLGKQETIF
jgi:hypothetical protein